MQPHYGDLRRYQFPASFNNLSTQLNLHPVEHNIPTPNPSTASERPRRPDLSTFFSNLEQVDTSNDHRTHHNAHALPLPGDVTALFRTLAEAYERMRQDSPGDQTELLESLIQRLMSDADSPPTEVKGVPDTFLEGEAPQTIYVKARKEGLLI